VLQQALLAALTRICTFYGLPPPEPNSTTVPNPRSFWLQPHSHNHLRLTRIIRSLRILGLQREARVFAAVVLRAASGKVSVTSKRFWCRAALWPGEWAPDGWTTTAWVKELDRGKENGGRETEEVKFLEGIWRVVDEEGMARAGWHEESASGSKG